MPHNLPDGCKQRDIDDAMESPREPVCPECGSDNVEQLHHFATWIPECYYWQCDDCNHQWGHE